MNSHRPAFLDTPIVRTLPPSCFDSPIIDARIHVSKSGITISYDGQQRSISMSALLAHMQIARKKLVTPGQAQAYEFIRQQAALGIAVSLQEIATACNLKSVDTAWKRVKGLIDAGLVRKNLRGRGRNLELVR